MNETIRPNVQDSFLNAVRKAEVPVNIYVTNGFLLKNAKVLSFDSFSILIESGGIQTLVYKHAVSTITPTESIDIKGDAK